jgi:hypothetical protein
MADKVKVQVYTTDGNIYEYEVESEEKARDHMDKIVESGYRRKENENTLVWYPPQYILKVKAKPFKGGYYNDKVVS